MSYVPELPSLGHAKNYVASKQPAWRTQAGSASAYVRSRGRNALAQEFRGDLAWLRQHVCPWLDTPEHKAELRGALATVQVALDPEWAAVAGIVVEALDLVCHPPRSPWGWIGAGAAGLGLIAVAVLSWWPRDGRDGRKKGRRR